MPLKHLIRCTLTRPTWAALIVAIVPALLLAAAFIFQYGLGLAPCVLCIYQRWPYAVLVLIGLTAFTLAHRGRANTARALIALSAVIFAGESLLAFYHVGVEHLWWKSPFQSCTGGLDAGGGKSILEQIESAAITRCDAVAWSMFGISMAGYNALIALAMSVWCAMAARMTGRSRI